MSYILTLKLYLVVLHALPTPRNDDLEFTSLSFHSSQLNNDEVGPGYLLVLTLVALLRLSLLLRRNYAAGDGTRRSGVEKTLTRAKAVCPPRSLPAPSPLPHRTTAIIIEQTAYGMPLPFILHRVASASSLFSLKRMIADMMYVCTNFYSVFSRSLCLSLFNPHTITFAG